VEREEGRWKDFNNTPSPWPSPARWRGEKEDEKILTIPLTLALSRGGERGERRWKGLNNVPHPDPLPRGGEGRRKMKRF
jgi:hypothetical protein